MYSALVRDNLPNPQGRLSSGGSVPPPNWGAAPPAASTIRMPAAAPVGYSTGYGSQPGALAWGGAPSAGGFDAQVLPSNLDHDPISLPLALPSPDL